MKTPQELVLKIGNPTLRKSCKEVSPDLITTAAFQKKLNLLNKILFTYRRKTGQGRGIAAPQIGIPLRFFILYTPKKTIKIINPKITKRSKIKLSYPEVCMSAEPIVAPVIRPSWVEFEYLDERAKEKKWLVKDKTRLGKMLNRVCLHEIDHLDGIINIDLVSSTKLTIMEKNQKGAFRKV